MDNTPKTIQLSEPITLGTQTIESLTIRKPTAKHMRKMPLGGGGDIGTMLDMLAELADVPPSTVDLLGIADMTAALEILGDFLQPSPATTSKP